MSRTKTSVPDGAAAGEAAEKGVPAFRKEPVESMVGICPYYVRERGKGVVNCECARFRFPDTLVRREIVYTFCGHPSGYKLCPLKVALDHYYERKYAQINEAE